MTEHPPSRFPDPRTGPTDAPLAWGGDLEPVTLLDAYRHGIFPWPDDGTLYWWSPDPRAVLPLDGLHVSRSLRRSVGSGRFRCTVDTAFAEVVAACAERPADGTGDGGTWIIPPLRAAYDALHALGVAHSVETWDARTGALVGGLYGIALGGAFTGESMFHRATDASKVALVHLVAHLRARGFTLLDAQLATPHLATLGADTLRRGDFLDRLAQAQRQPVSL